MKDMIDAITNYGVTVVVIAYFLIRDYKFQIKLVESLQAIKDAITKSKEQ